MFLQNQNSQMKFFHRCLCDHLPEEQKAAVLLSVTCKGNDPTLPLCPLFHGSLGPLLFAEDIRDSPLHSPLLYSHNITWAKHINVPGNVELCSQLCDTLRNTGYSSRSANKQYLQRDTVNEFAQISYAFSDGSALLPNGCFCSNRIPMLASRTFLLNVDALVNNFCESFYIK